MSNYLAVIDLQHRAAQSWERCVVNGSCMRPRLTWTVLPPRFPSYSLYRRCGRECPRLRYFNENGSFAELRGADVSKAGKALRVELPPLHHVVEALLARYVR